jgi:cyclic beta-1,2-glucan synthetase
MGSAGWMYRAGIEGILGIRRVGGELIVEPCLPDAWPGFEARVREASTLYEISVTAPAAADLLTSSAMLDGAAVTLIDGCLRVPLDGVPPSSLARRGAPAEP